MYPFCLGGWLCPSLHFLGVCTIYLTSTASFYYFLKPSGYRFLESWIDLKLLISCSSNIHIISNQQKFSSNYRQSSLSWPDPLSTFFEVFSYTVIPICKVSKKPRWTNPILLQQLCTMIAEHHHFRSLF